MGERGRKLLGLSGMSSGSDDDGDDDDLMSEGTKAKGGSEVGEGKRAAMEDFHAAMNADGGPDHEGMARALEDFHDIHAASKKGGET